MRLDLNIDRLVVETPLERLRADELRGVLEEGLRRLAERLERSPLSRVPMKDLVVESLAIDTQSADALLGPRGAERFADALYRVIFERPHR